MTYKTLMLIALLGLGAGTSIQANELDEDAKLDRPVSGVVIRENNESGEFEIFTYEAEKDVTNEETAKIVSASLGEPVFKGNKSSLNGGDTILASELDNGDETGTEAWVYYYYTPTPVYPYVAPGGFTYYTTPYTVNYFNYGGMASPYYATYYTSYYNNAVPWTYYFYRWY